MSVRFRDITVTTDDHGSDILMVCPTCGPFFEMPATDETQGVVLTFDVMAAAANEHDCEDGAE